jgi:hypothetical protein
MTVLDAGFFPAELRRLLATAGGGAGPVAARATTGGRP